MNGVNTNGDFLKELQEIIRNNLKDADFGVSSLAKEVGMSRSNLHKKVHALAKISVSQFIRQERLQAGLKLLKQTSSTVSEIAYEVGFNNVSYFIKCFHEYYGYSPGEVGKREQEVSDAQTGTKRKIKLGYIAGALIVLILVISAFVFYNSKEKGNVPKTVAILPPYYETRDTSYLSVINGTVQNVIDNLNLIKDIDRITPWLSVLQYKNSTKPAPEIAKELNVSYVVKPSVLSYGGNIHLKFGLIEGLKDNPIWTGSYTLDVNDLTLIYQEISKEIAQGINAQITPAEKERIEKPITTNGKALNYYNAGVDYWNLWLKNGEKENLEKAITQFETTLKYDKECASAWAQLCNSNFEYYIRFNRNSESIKNNIFKYASRAYLHDSNLDKSLYAMALSSTVLKDYETATIYLNKVLEYNPRSAWAYTLLSRLYRWQQATSPEIVEFALKSLEYTKSIKDSLEVARILLSTATILRSAGFYEYALNLINESINLNPDNPGFPREKSEIIMIKEQNVDSAKIILKNLINKHKEYLGAKRFLFKDLFLNREYEKAYVLFVNIYGSIGNRNIDTISPFSGIDAQRFLVTLDRLNRKKEYAIFKKTYLENYNISTRYDSYLKSYHLLRSFCAIKDAEKAWQEMQNFSKEKYFRAQHIYMLEFSPLFDILRENKLYQEEYQKMLDTIKIRFENNRKEIRKSMVEKGLLAELMNS